MSHRPFRKSRSFSAFASAAKEAEKRHNPPTQEEPMPSDFGEGGANAKPREVTTLERRVLAHERILQALIGHLADDDPIIFEQLNARFGCGHDLGVYEQDYVSTAHFCEHFLGAIEEQISARRAQKARHISASIAKKSQTIGNSGLNEDMMDRAQRQEWENEGGALTIPLTPLRPAYFQIFRAEMVMLTSTQFAGGDWQWQLHASTGALIAGGYGFLTKADCLKAVRFVQDRSQSAKILID